MIQSTKRDQVDSLPLKYALVKNVYFTCAWLLFHVMGTFTFTLPILWPFIIQKTQNYKELIYSLNILSAYLCLQYNQLLYQFRQTGYLDS